MTRQVTIPTAVPQSCTSKLSDFSYPSACPTYRLGQSFDSFLTSACQTFCQSECIDPFLKYMEACNLDTTNVQRYCGSSNGKLCCSLLTTPSGFLSALGFYSTCGNCISLFNNVIIPPTCTSTYNSYGCCLENLNNALGQSFSWSSCRFSTPSECLYEPWPLAISKNTLIAITVGGGGGLILLCALACCCVCCCCLCGVCGSRKRVTVTTTKMRPFA